jgi:hypothetical protein
MATIPGEGSTPKLSEVSADLRNVVNSVVDYKKKNGESPLQKEARDNIATKDKINKVEDYAGIGTGTVAIPQLLKSSIKGGAITIATAVIVGAANTVIDQQMPSNPENITKTTSVKSTTTNYPSGVVIGTPNPKELDKK